VPRAPHQPFTVEALWQLERLGSPSLAPDGRRAVLSVATTSLAQNRHRSALRLVSLQGGATRELTCAGESDGQPRWSPRGDRIAFLARREQQGQRDSTPQLYLIDPDGGEARRASQVATGVEAFRWLPDGEHIVFISWVWPEERGSAAQARRLHAWTARQASGIATSEPQCRWWDRLLPPGRVPHLHLLALRSGRVRDLFEGTPHALSRLDPGLNDFDIAPDGRRIVFSADPASAPQLGNPQALFELALDARGRPQGITTLLQSPDWHAQAPRYSPDGARIAFIASRVGAGGADGHGAHGEQPNGPPQLALWQRDDNGSPRWQIESADWDHRVEAPLHWLADGSALLLSAEARGRRHLWRFTLATRQAHVEHVGGWVSAFDHAGGTTLLLTESQRHPAQAWALRPGRAARRVERSNDARLKRHRFGHHEVVTLPSPPNRSDAAELWLTFPPDFDAAAQRHPVRHPVLLLLHGGPHSALGESWQTRWQPQVFAAQGFVVASLNFHGSSGYGQDFLASIQGRWGELELQDIDAATRWLCTQPWVDATRLHAGGGSYGGFLVALLNGRSVPGRFASLVCHAGCFDWAAMFASDASRWHWQGLGASYWQEPQRIQTLSPASHAAAMQTPTLISHGARDQRVPEAQSLAFYNTLKARGVEARLLWFPDEHHWIMQPANSRLWYAEVLAWLTAHRSVVATPDAPLDATSS
jgi:dipeptidyl aminopeptidase/acylaminoacyl peptidase